MTEEQRKKIFEDAEVVCALHKLAAEGYDVIETKELKDENGKIFQIETMTRHVPPSVEAAIFWLTNRQPGKWKIGDEAMAVILGKVDAQLEQYFQHQPDS
jgi:hypothetical protein